jgi:hypothetical protein
MSSSPPMLTHDNTTKPDDRTYTLDSNEVSPVDAGLDGDPSPHNEEAVTITRSLPRQYPSTHTRLNFNLGLKTASTGAIGGGKLPHGL